jgi:uncharacterized protein (DUF362 family)
MTADTILEFLREHQGSPGGWGYWPEGPPAVEPTCFALLALAAARDRYQAAIDKGLSWLCREQDGDGAFRVHKTCPMAVWPTALALFVLEHFQADPGARGLACRWLLQTQPRKLHDPRAYRRDFDIDPELVGWPWTEGTFSWTEPTSWACLALRRAGFGQHPRVREGLRLLVDRTFDDGGVNSGNRRVFGRLTEPVPSTSAVMLLAFAGEPDHPRLEATRRYLLRTAQASDDVEHLAWIRLALEPWRSDPQVEPHLPDIARRLLQAYAARQQARHFRRSVLREALVVLALRAPQLVSFPCSRREPADLPEVPASRAAPSWLERVRRGLRGLGVRAVGQLRGLPDRTCVHIAAAAGYDDDLVAVLEQQYAHFQQLVPLSGKRVVLKPNLVEYHPDRVINTDPRLVAAVIELCQGQGAAEVVVAEGPGHWRNTEYLVEASGLGSVLRRYGVTFVDLNHDEPVAVPNLGRLTGLELLHLARTVVEADVLISLPKLKTHHWAGVTLSLKNLFGTLPGICYGWPKNELHWRGIDNSIVDIGLTRTPELAIVDGIVAMEGDGPLNGTPVALGVIVMGVDPVAVDATCCRLMQLDPQRVPHLQLAYRHKLGLLPEHRILQLGLPIAERSRPFQVLPRFQQLRQEAPTLR